MAQTTVSSSGLIPPLFQRVYLNDTLRRDLIVTNVSRSIGIGGSNCSVWVSQKDWDDNKNRFLGSKIVVYSTLSTSGNGNYCYNSNLQDVDFGKPLFRGYITNATGNLSVSENRIQLQAKSMIQLCDKVFLGSCSPENGFLYLYPKEALRDGVLTDTNWDVSQIIRDWFSSSLRTWRYGGGNIPNTWRSEIKLGSLNSLNQSAKKVPIGNLEFNRLNVSDAISQILDIVGNIKLVERFETNATYFDFMDIKSNRNIRKNIIVAEAGECVAGSNYNVLSITDDSNIEEVVNRIVGYGDYRKFIVTASTNHVTAPLEKIWNTSLEDDVLADPDITKRGTRDGQNSELEGWNEEYENVFKVYRLPAPLRKFVIESGLEIDNIEIQVFKLPRIMSPGYGYGYGYNDEGYSYGYNDNCGESPYYDYFVSIGSDPDVWESEIAPQPTIVEGSEINLTSDGNYTFKLKEPALNLCSTSINYDLFGFPTPVFTWTEAEIYITLTYRKDPIYYDTGRIGEVDYYSLQDGVYDQIQNDSFRYIQITNIDYPILDDDGNSHIFDDVWIYKSSDEGSLPKGYYHVTSKNIVIDDSQNLNKFTKLALDERNDIRKNYNIVIPKFTKGYSLGDTVIILNQKDYNYGNHLIQSINYDITSNHKTTISTDNQSPLIWQNLGTSSFDTGSDIFGAN